MTIKINRWSPDTCGCIMEYSWDDSVPQDEIVLTPTTVVSRCAAHTSLATKEDVYGVLMEENPRKNRAHQHILDNGPASLYDLGGEDGTTKLLKKGITINWSWTGTAPNRILTLTITGITLTTQQRTAVQNALNTRFGTGKVILG